MLGEYPIKGRGAADESDTFSYFDMLSVPSDEVLNGRPLYGVQLIASGENAQDVLLEALQQGRKDRVGLCYALKQKCPDLTKAMSENQLYRFVDNRLTELRQLGKAKIVERGTWAAIGGSNGT